MNGSRSNAFLGQGFSIGGHPRSSLASMLASMRAKLETNAGGYRLSLTPMRFIDAMPRWFDIDPGPHVRNLLLDSPAPVSNPSPAPSSLNRLLDRCNITARDSFGDDLKVLDDDGLRKLVAGNVDEKPLVVRILGPVEEADALAVKSALRQGRSALEAEVRAMASLRMLSPRSVSLETRDKSSCLSMVAESFRHYVAALRRCSVRDISVPQIWQMERLLDLEGEIAVRPIETEVYSSSIDIGICIQEGGPTRPANCSLIYDVYSNTWHDEP